MALALVYISPFELNLVGDMFIAIVVPNITILLLILTAWLKTSIVLTQDVSKPTERCSFEFIEIILLLVADAFLDFREPIIC